MAPKKAILIVVVILASVLSVSFAGGHRKLATTVGDVKKELFDSRGASLVHPRTLVVKTNDYGGYDPSPSFSKPGWKPIPH